MLVKEEMGVKCEYLNIQGKEGRFLFLLQALAYLHEKLALSESSSELYKEISDLTT